MYPNSRVWQRALRLCRYRPTVNVDYAYFLRRIERDQGRHPTFRTLAVTLPREAYILVCEEAKQNLLSAFSLSNSGMAIVKHVDGGGEPYPASCLGELGHRVSTGKDPGFYTQQSSWRTILM